MIPSGAENVANYRIIAACADGRFGPNDARTIRIKSAVYNPATDTVTLTPVHRLNWHRRYEIKVNGSSPTGLTDLFGNLLDGVGNGKPGSNYSAVFRHWGIDPTYHAPRGPRTSTKMTFVSVVDPKGSLQVHRASCERWAISPLMV